MPKRKNLNRVVIVIKDYSFIDRVTEAPDGEKALIEEYPVDKLNADHDKWLLSEPRIGV
jgi:hypothetical protein